MTWARPTGGGRGGRCEREGAGQVHGEAASWPRAPVTLPTHLCVLATASPAFAHDNLVGSPEDSVAMGPPLALAVTCSVAWSKSLTCSGCQGPHL